MIAVFSRAGLYLVLALVPFPASIRPIQESDFAAPRTSYASVHAPIHWNNRPGFAFAVESGDWTTRALSPRSRLTSQTGADPQELSENTSTAEPTATAVAFPDRYIVALSELISLERRRDAITDLARRYPLAVGSIFPSDTRFQAIIGSPEILAAIQADPRVGTVEQDPGFPFGNPYSMIDSAITPTPQQAPVAVPVPGRYLVGLAEIVAPAERRQTISQLAQRHRLSVAVVFADASAFVAIIGCDEPQTVAALQTDPQVRYVAQDYAAPVTDVSPMGAPSAIPTATHNPACSGRRTLYTA